MIEETPVSLIEAIKKRIKYLEDNDPGNVSLELLKQQISDCVLVEDNI